MSANMKNLAKKRALIICHSDYYDNRIRFIEQFLIQKNCSVHILVSDFDHIKKQKKIPRKENYFQIETKPYYKNISFQRIISHNNFSKKVKKTIEILKPDILWVMIPPNSLVENISQYKKENPKLFLIYDVIDMWPETLPFRNSALLKIPSYLWKQIRDKGISAADIIVTECNLYKTKLPQTQKKVQTVYMGKPEQKSFSHLVVWEEMIQFCYLGSINNIIDISKIVTFLNQLQKKKKIFLHIIGDGESRDKFIDELKMKKINYKYYGKIFDEKNKEGVLGKCHFGLNIMKEDVFIGLTMKSIDYFKTSLPLINTIKGDTEELINQYAAGINLDLLGLDESVNQLIKMKSNDYKKMRENTKLLYENNFSGKAIEKQIDELFMDVTPKIFEKG